MSHTATNIDTSDITSILEENQHYLNDLIFAARAQKSLLPKIPQLDYLEFGVLYKPNGEVSGDLYDFSNHHDEAYNAFLGDATGHGIAAAFICVMAHMALKIKSQSDMPDCALARLNNQLHSSIPTGYFMTAIHLQITREGWLNMSSAGHPPLLVIPADGSPIISLSTSGLPLGVMQSSHNSYELADYSLAVGDKILITTDGVQESSNPEGEYFGDDRLIGFLEEHRDKSPQKLINRLESRLLEFASGRMHDDDVTAVCIEYKGDLIA